MSAPRVPADHAALRVGRGQPYPLPRAGQTVWAGDPAVAAGAPGEVVMLNLGGIPQQNKQMVVASISLDGGRTFLNTVRVNNESGDCGGGTQDQEHAVFDLGTSPPTLWVVWRHQGTSTYGGCVRGGIVNATDPAQPTIDWLGPALTVDNMDRDDPAVGQGGMLIAARTVDTAQGPFTRISVMYSNTAHIFFDCSGGKSIGWSTVTSDNLGIDWYSHVRVTSTNDFGWCAASNTVQLNWREFWFAQDPTTGAYWAAVHESPSQIGVFHSPDEGASWVRVQSIDLPGQVLFQPTIAVDTFGRVALNYWQDDGGLLIQRMGVGTGAGVSDWSSPIELTPWFVPDAGQNSNGGDYQSLISVPFGVFPGGATFMAAWSQELNVTTMPMAVTP